MIRKDAQIPSGLLNRFGRGLQPRRIEVPIASGFSGASILHLHCDQGEFCLRAWPAPGLPTQRILGLHRLLEFTFEAGVCQVAVPLKSDSATTLVEMDGRRWQLEPWMPGIADFWTNRSDARLRAAVRCLAGWHRAAVAFVPDNRETKWFASSPGDRSPAVSERINLIDSWSPDKLEALRQRFRGGDWPRLSDLGSQMVALFERTAATIADELRTVQRQRFPLQPCLRDVWHDHVLFTGDEVTGLIDPSACRTENVATDLARLLGSFVGDDAASWDVAINEYTNVRPISLPEMALIHVLDRSSVLLSGMNWLDRILLRQELPADRSRVEERIQTIVQRLTHLADQM